MTARPATFGQNALVGGLVSLIVWPASSLRLGKLARSESWARCLANLTDEEMEEHGDSAAYWLAEIAGPPPLVTG